MFKVQEAAFTLNAFILWLISGGATIVIRFIAARIPLLQRELSEAERGVVTMFFSVVLIGLAFIGATRAGYIPMPQTELEWFEALFTPIATAIGIPALMTTAMGTKEARYHKREGTVRASSYPKADKLILPWPW